MNKASKNKAYQITSSSWKYITNPIKNADGNYTIIGKKNKFSGKVIMY
tara:strand:- start:15 stop:158 length:144 start_codon:yes stop_codon:yes gene_type:complete